MEMNTRGNGSALKSLKWRATAPKFTFINFTAQLTGSGTPPATLWRSNMPAAIFPRSKCRSYLDANSNWRRAIPIYFTHLSSGVARSRPLNNVVAICGFFLITWTKTQLLKFGIVLRFATLPIIRVPFRRPDKGATSDFPYYSFLLFLGEHKLVADIFAESRQFGNCCGITFSGFLGQH